MKCRLFYGVVIAMLACAPAGAQSADPPELVRLRASYEAAVARAVKPLSETYITELTKAQEAYTRAAKLDEALKIANEIKIAKERLALLAATPTSPLSSSPAGGSTSSGGGAAAANGVRVTIPANDPNGHAIGAVKRGDTITLQYIGGVWKSHGGIATANPDDPKVERGDENRLAIARAPINGVPGDVIKIVPPATAQQPFVYMFQTSRDDVVLRISTNSDRKENPGAVTYLVTVKRGS